MIADNYCAENEMILSVFLGLIENSVIDAKKSYMQLKNINNTKMDEKEIRQTVWVAIDDFLKDAAMASKFLFPSSSKKMTKDRGEALRYLFNIKDGSFNELRSRLLRNRIVHLDEDLDEWWNKKKKAGSMTLALKTIDGLDNDVIYDNSVDLAFMYNPANGQLYHLGNYFEIHSLFSELKDIGEKISEARKKLRNLVKSPTIRLER